MAEKAVVVGGCRFLGLETALLLRDDGYDVTVLDDRRCEGVDLEVAGPPSTAGPGRDPLDKAKLIINFYEYDGVNEARLNPEKAYEANTLLAWRLARAAVQGRADRLIHVSTAAVYGDPLDTPVHEAHPTMPKSTYGATRLAGEALVEGHMRERGVAHVVLRVFNAYGPGQWNRGNPGVVHEFLIRATNNLPLRIEGDGLQTRDFVYSRDVVIAVRKALDAPPGTFNIGTGRATSILDLADHVARLVGRKLEVVWAPPRPGDIRDSVAHPGLPAKVLRWQARTSLERGLAELARYYLE